MRHVAFFRNLNLGQARSRSPGSAELVTAFESSGAVEVVNFQTNGTVIFTGTAPVRIADEVAAALHGLTGYRDLVVVRPASWVVSLASSLDPGLPGGEVALFNARTVPALDLPWVAVGTGHATVTIHALGKQHAVSSSVGPGGGSNPVLTDLLGVPVTCRGIGTMIRLARRLAATKGQRPDTRLSANPPLPASC